MKKILFLFIMILFAAKAFAYTTPQELAKGEGRLEDVANWVKNNIHYDKPSGNGYCWQKPEETLQLGAGDCKDFAVLFYTAIKYFGYEAHIYVVNWKISGHAICVFKNRCGYWQIFDTAGLHDEWLDDIGRLIKYTYLGCTDYYCV